MKTRINNVQAVIDGQTVSTSVLINGGKIADIDARHASSVDEEIDGEGLHLLPGVIDDQVHFREPGLTHKEDLEHATRACAKGGITTFLEMPNTVPTTTSESNLFDKLHRASQVCLVNYGFYVGATPHNLEFLKSAVRTPGIKIFIGSSTGDLLVDDQHDLERIFAETSLPLTAHCEDETTVRANAERFADSSDVADHSRIRDHRAAVIATQRAIDLSHRHRHPFHVLHVSTAAEIPLLADHRNLITAEVCPHHLFFNVDDYQRLGSLVKMNPSIKTADDNRALFAALVDGTIQVVATDHAPHTLQEKQLPFPQCPSGLPAVENSLALMLDQVHRGAITLERVVEAMCHAPAKLWNIVDKGQIQVGYDADLVLVDLQLQQTILNENQQTKCKWSPWHQTTLTRWPVRTWVMGQTVFQRSSDGRESYASAPRGQEARFDLSRGGYWQSR